MSLNILIFITGAFLASSFWSGWYESARGLQLEARAIVAKCELNLPRNQSCEYVITARVKESNDE